MKAALTITLSALAAAAALIGISAPLASAQSAIAVQRESSYNSTSGNWSGYAVQKSGVSYSDVKATFTVPKLICDTDALRTSAEWVGLGGYSGTPAIEQTGVESDCVAANTPSYYAWYENYPNPLVVAGLAIHGGDVINAEVQFVSGTSFKYLLTDKTTGKSFNSGNRPATAGSSRSTAEWIVEQPDYPYATLPDIGNVPFSAATSTGNGHAGPISYTGWNDYRITLQPDNAPVQATTSSLGAAGNSFTVTWLPPCPRCTTEA